MKVWLAMQSLHDADKAAFRFFLCGSSARRLKTTGGNLLPGRSILHRLYPLINEEYGKEAEPFEAEFSPLALEHSTSYQFLEDMFIGFTVPAFSICRCSRPQRLD